MCTRKYSKLFLLVVLFFYTVLFSQTKRNSLENNHKNDNKFQEKSLCTSEEKDHWLNMSGNKITIPFATANERQLAVIQNALVEDFLVNDDTTGGAPQYYSSVAMDSKGNFVIVWQDSRNIGYVDNYDIYFQRYDASGVALGGNQKVNDDSGTAKQVLPSIAMDDSGNFVIVWKDYRNSYLADIYFQLYNDSGVAQGCNQRVNYGEKPGFSSDRFSFAIATCCNCFVITWDDYTKYYWDVFFQCYDALGVERGTIHKVQTGVDKASQIEPAIAMDDSGNFTIVWRDTRRGGMTDCDIYFQRYDASGMTRGANQKANDNDTGEYQEDPCIAMAGNGNFVIAWTDKRNEGLYWGDIYFQRYNASGNAQGINCKANDDSGTVEQINPAIAMHENSNFMIAWHDKRNDDNIYYQCYNAFGVPQGTNLITNDPVGRPYYPQISIAGSKDFIIAWDDDRYGRSAIYFQRYSGLGVASGANKKIHDDSGISDQEYPSIAMDAYGNFGIAWQDSRDGYIKDIYFQQYTSSGIKKGVNQHANDDMATTWKKHAAIAMNNSGNFVIAWSDPRNGDVGDIYFQRYDAMGISQGANEKANDDSGRITQIFPSIAINENGNFVIAWTDARNDRDDIYFQRYDALGLAIGVNQKANVDGTGRDASVAMDRRGNFVIAWHNGDNIYFQRYDASRFEIGDNQKANADGEGEIPGIAMDGNGNFVIAWRQHFNNEYDIYFQRYDASGRLLGANQKANDDTIDAHQDEPSIAMDENGNFVIVWEDSRYNITRDIIAQRYYPDGTKRGNNYIVVDDPAFYKRRPVVAANTNQIVFAWEDKRRARGWDIYAKIVPWDWEGEAAVFNSTNIAPQNFVLCQNYPNPFNATTRIDYSLAKDSQVKITVYNLLGQVVAVLVDGYQTKGLHSVTWDAHSQPSGIYLYRLKAEGFSAALKMFLQK